MSTRTAEKWTPYRKLDLVRLGEAAERAKAALGVNATALSLEEAARMLNAASLEEAVKEYEKNKKEKVVGGVSSDRVVATLYMEYADLTNKTTVSQDTKEVLALSFSVTAVELTQIKKDMGSLGIKEVDTYMRCALEFLSKGILMAEGTRSVVMKSRTKEMAVALAPQY